MTSPAVAPTRTPTKAPTIITEPEPDSEPWHRADPEKLCPEQKGRTITRIAPHLP